MNAQLRASLMRLPVPMQAPGQPARAGVARTEAGWRLYWLIGLRRELFGPIFPSSREATAVGIELNDRNAV